MLNYIKAFSGFSVNNLETAKAFYTQKLGLSVKEGMGLELLLADGKNVFLYPKNNHEPATYTVLNFLVKNIEKAVDELRSKGIEFEKYTGELQTDDKGIFRDGGPLIAWFKDPSGNILSVIEEKTNN